MIDIETLAVAKKYTNDSMEGAGAVAGKPCQIQSITEIPGGNHVTFLWIDNSDVEHTSAMDVMDGAKGDKGDSGDAGLGIKSVAVNAEDHLIITYDDDTTQDAGQILVAAAVDSVNGKTGDVVLDASDVGALPDDTDIPSKTSDLTNDSIVDGASYDSANHQILFKNGSTTLFSLDAAAFVKDGMVDDVEISGGNLVITFNTDAGKQAISIPLTDIFDPANYYYKDDVDGLLADKADKTDVDSVIAGQQSLLKDTVGWTGKNLLVYPYYQTTRTTNGITYTDNGDGSITADGTATAEAYQVMRMRNSDDGLKLKAGKYVLSGCPTGGGQSVYQLYIINADNTLTLARDTGDGATFTLDSDITAYGVLIRVSSGVTVSSLTFYPMIRYADIADDTWESYHESVETMYEEEIHGVNLFKPDFTKKTENGITYSVSSDNSISTSGTATADTRTDLGKMFLEKGTYILSGNPYKFDASTNTIRLRLYNSLDTKIFWDDGNGATFTIDSAEEYTLAVRYGSGAVFGNTFKPMLRKAEIEDSTYRSYNEQAIQNQLNDKGVLGTKNRLKFPYCHVSGSPIPVGGSVENTGITYTVNSDGSITANGTSTGGSYCIFNRKQDWSDFDLYGKRVKLSVKPVSANVYIQLYDTDNNKTLFRTDSVTGEVEFVFPASLKNNTSWNISIDFPTGAEPNNATYYPMLRLASDPDDTYAPYTMTNRELTEKMSHNILSSDYDLNDITTEGEYYWTTSAPTNSPQNLTWCNLKVYRCGAIIRQIAFYAGDRMYIREYGGSPIKWSSWYKFTGEAVS